MHLFDSLATYGHERLCFHHDPATGLRAMVAIHSTVLGDALGGTRRWCYATEEEARAGHEEVVTAWMSRPPGYIYHGKSTTF